MITLFRPVQDARSNLPSLKEIKSHQVKEMVPIDRQPKKELPALDGLPYHPLSSSMFKNISAYSALAPR
jgi:hypothetical protein